MRRIEDITIAREDTRGNDEGLAQRALDGVVTTMSTVAAVYLCIAGRWAPGAMVAAATFGVIALGPPVFRSLARRYPNRRIYDFIASIWLMPAAIFAHSSLGPLVDTVNPRLLDGYLARADLSLFGVHPAVVLGNMAAPWVTELLLVCYYSYFIGPLGLALLLLFGPRRAEFDEYALTLALFFSVNFALYIAVPAIGPRYYLAGLFAQPLHGVWLTPFLDGLMRTTAFARDCFPSGHTGVTMVMLIFAWRWKRWYFWMMLPVGMGLVCGTLVGRFHYGIDLICAVPLALAATSVAAAVARRGENVSERMIRAVRRLARV